MKPLFTSRMLFFAMNQLITRRRALSRLAGATAAAVATQLADAAEPDQLRHTMNKHRPKLIAFDVIETLFDLAPLDTALVEIGLPKGSLQVWFPRLLRDAFALEVIGEYKPFRDIATGSLGALCRSHQLDVSPAKLEQVLGNFTTLPPHPDVKPAMEMFRAAGVRMITLTNGSKDATEALLKKAGLEGFIERSISIDEVKHWKPAAAVYRFAAEAMKLPPREIALIAAHDWDTAGASRAGFLTGGVQRGNAFSTALPPPDFMATTLPELVKALLSLPA